MSLYTNLLVSLSHAQLNDAAFNGRAIVRIAIHRSELQLSCVELHADMTLIAVQGNVYPFSVSSRMLRDVNL